MFPASPKKAWRGALCVILRDELTYLIDIVLLSIVVVVVAVVAVGCGGGSSGATVACTMGAGTSKTCVEYDIPSGASAEAIQGQNDACVSGGGLASSACSHQGADGACRVTSTAPGASPTVTTWVYAGNTATEMMACTSNGQVWLTP
jgi:hypothetical protein